jgi:hypothetical protein
VDESRGSFVDEEPTENREDIVEEEKLSSDCSEKGPAPISKSKTLTTTPQENSAACKHFDGEEGAKSLSDDEPDRKRVRTE